MRRRVRDPGAASTKINVTPMIDVVMCLIVFFLIVGQLAANRNVRLDLPESGAGDPARSRTPLVINAAIDPAGGARIVIDAREIDLDRLETEIRAGSAESDGVQLRADRRLAYAQIRPIIDACRAVGVRVVGLATEGRP